MTDKKAQILAATTALFLEHGIGVSTAKIAKAAGISNGTLFNVFPTKQVLIDTLYCDAKIGMFAILPHSGNASFNRAHLYDNWQAYLAWAKNHPETRQVMQLLLDSGLASADSQAKVNAACTPHIDWLRHALEANVIRGPSVNFIGQLIFFHLDHVINETLNSTQTDLAFEMLCQAIGLNQ